MGQEHRYMVCTRCMTYNHSLYIEDALRGFAMQETSFPAVFVIIDDASTDGEQQVLKKWTSDHLEQEDGVVFWKEMPYGQLMTAKLKGKPHFTFVVLLLAENHFQKGIGRKRLEYIAEWNESAKYSALCEGDDYWIDPMKLQKQVDALEAHPDCAIAFCKTRRISAIDNKLGTTIPLNNHIKEGIVDMNIYLREQFSKGIWTFHTSSYLMNRKFFQDDDPIKIEFISHFPFGDLANILWGLLNGNGFFLNFEGSCYRTQSGGYNTKYRKDKDFAKSQSEKLVAGLKFFDEYSKKQYHKYVKTRIKHIEYFSEINQGHHLVFFKPYYWDSYNITFIKSRIRSFISERFPRGYHFFLNLKNR